MKHDVMLDRLSEIARTNAPPPLSPAEENEMLRAALARAERAVKTAEPRQGGRHGARARLVAAAVALLAIGTTVAWRYAGVAEDDVVTPSSASGEPTHVELPTGDRLTSTPGASFRIRSSTLHERSVAMQSGTMVFDVARLGGEQAFEVTTPHFAIRVLGTVFSVTATDEVTVVRVFEGAVAVRMGDDRRIVRASQRFSSTDDAVVPIDDESPLAAFAWRAAASRDDTRAEATTPASEPTSPPEPAHAAADVSGGTVPSETSGRDRVERADPDTARALITGGRADRALALARRHDGGEWRHVEADALRALRRFDDAADAYDRAAIELHGARAQQAGYLAASIRLLELGDPALALASLDRAQVDAPGSPLEERALALRVRALLRVERDADARLAAERYLAAHPEGGMADFMRSLGETATPASGEARDELE